MLAHASYREAECQLQLDKPDEAIKMGTPPNWMGHVQVENVDTTVQRAKQLGMTKVQFHHELGISRMHLFRCLRDGPPKLVKLAVLGLWYSRKMGDILEAPEPTGQAQTPAKRRQKKS